jgi:hypothetical protein
MSALVILDQLSELYGHPTPAVLEQNNKIFRSPYLAANPPEVFFRRIQDCAKIALLGRNPYTDHQLINNTICLLLTTGLYLHPFKDWDPLLSQAQTWLALRAMIQESFQRRLNETAPTAGHRGYAPAMPFQQNAFSALAENDSDNKSLAASVATQVVALTHQSQITSSAVANTSQHHDQQMAHIALQQDLMHQNMHQIIDALNAVAFNANDEGRGIRCYAGGRGRGRARQARGRGRGPPMYAIGGRGFNPGGPTGGHMVPYTPMAPLMIAPAYRAPRLGNPFGIPRNSAIFPISDLLDSGIFIGILFFRS